MMPPRTSKSPECDPRQADWCAEKFELLFSKIDYLTKLISGNGEPGINERLRAIEAQSSVERDERAALKSRVRTLMWTIIGTAATLIVTYVWGRVTGS